MQFHRDLIKHASEFGRAIRNKRYERTDAGLYFPEQHAFVGGNLGIARNFGGMEWCDNLVPNQGLDYLLASGLAGGAVQSSWYIAPFATNTAPSSGSTAANFNTNQTEFINYSETTRQYWNQAGSSGGVISNAASLATITIGSGGQTAVYGAAMLSAQAKGATTGVMFADALATTPKTGLELGETLSFSYAITATSS